MSDATDTATDGGEQPQALPGDGLREGIIDDLRRRIGDAIVDTHITPNDDLWIRVRTDAWRQTAEALKAAGFTFFSFLSGLDWYGKMLGVILCRFRFVIGIDGRFYICNRTFNQI